MFKQALIASAIMAMVSPTVFAYEDYIVNTDSVGRSEGGVVSSDQFLELGQPSPNALRLEAEQSLRMGHVDRAIMVLQRSLELAPMDIDTRMLYAEALEKKLRKQKDKDPSLYNFVIKQWYFVAKKAEFPDQQLNGASHLLNLTGHAPKVWESSKKYLSKVLIPEDGSQEVALGAHNSADKDKDKKGKKKDDDENM